ncbi:hypothetical protein, partial [Thiolapillus sp.]|uniref:hypothetical protein n=1 Tax=Thiolapillus sp. TaxID=2017437 RepID=UPI003AF5AD6F
MTRTAGAPIGCQRPSRFWGLGCPKIYHEAEDTLVKAKGWQRILSVILLALVVVVQCLQDHPRTSSLSQLGTSI